MALAEIVAWASLRRRPARTLFSVLGVAVGIAVVVSIAVVDRTTLVNARPDRAQGWRADLEVRPAPGVVDPAAELAAIVGVERFTEVLQGEAQLQGVDGGGQPQGERAQARLIGLEPAAFDMGLLRLRSGTALGASSEGAPEVLLGAPLADRLGLDAGDPVWLAPPARAARVDCVEGALVQQRPAGPGPTPTEFRVSGVLEAEGAGRIASGELLVVDVGAARALLAGQFQPSSFWLARDERVAPEKLQERLVANFAVDLRRGAIVGQQADEVAFRNGVRLAGLLSLALGLYVIFHTLSMSLVERAREMATLQALGASRGQIARIVFSEALVIAALAGAVGLGLGLLLAKAMLEAGISSLGLTGDVRGQFDVPWDEVIPLVLAGVGIALLGSVAPLLRARENEAVPLLRGEDPGAASGKPGRGARSFHIATLLLVVAALPMAFFLALPLVGEAERQLIGLVLLGLGVLALLIGTPLLVPGPVAVLARALAEPLRRLSPFSGLLAARSISLSPTRVAASAAAVALVTAAFVGLRGMTSSLALENENWVEEGVEGKLWVYQLGGVPWQPLAAALREQGLVQAVEPLDARLSAPFRVVGLPVAELAQAGLLAERPDLAARLSSAPSLVISRRLASQKNLRVGDQVAIATPSSGVVPFEVLAIDDRHGYLNRPHERAYAFAASTHMARLFCLETERSDTLALVLAPGADPLAVAEATKAYLRERALGSDKTGFGLASDIAAHERDDITRDFVVFDVILLLALILAGTGVLNGLLLAAMERAKELGVLRALGADFGQIARSVLLESAFIGAVGGALGLVLGLGLVPVVVSSLRVLSGLDLPQPGLRLVYVLGPVLALAISVLGGLYPLWRMGRTDPVRAVRTG